MLLMKKNDLNGKLSDVTRMLLVELQGMPEYEQLRLLANLKEKKERVELGQIEQEMGDKPASSNASRRNKTVAIMLHYIHNKPLAKRRQCSFNLFYTALVAQR
jgi:hypothetical protein